LAHRVDMAIKNNGQDFNQFNRQFNGDNKTKINDMNNIKEPSYKFKHPTPLSPTNESTVSFQGLPTHHSDNVHQFTFSPPAHSPVPTNEVGAHIEKVPIQREPHKLRKYSTDLGLDFPNRRKLRLEKLNQNNFTNLRKSRGENISYNPHIFKYFAQIEEEPYLNKLIKCFIAGMACSVIFYGIFYCIQNSNFILEKIFGWEKKVEREVSEKVHSIFGTPFKVHVKDTINVYPKFIEPEFLNTTLGEESKVEEGLSMINKIYDYFTIGEESLLNRLFSGGKFLVTNYLWTFFQNHAWQILAVICLKAILLKCYKSWKNNKRADVIFRDIKCRLHKIHTGSSPLKVMPEGEIIHEYSTEHGYKEDYFCRNILPLLEEMRQKDRHIAKREVCINERYKTAWCWRD
jgi:hypothetical protein